MKIKILMIVGIPLLLILAILVYFFVLPWVLIGLGIALSPNPPKPEITYGEFPFRLVYEIDGETKVIEDTLICEYDGIGMDEGRGKYREWKKSLASGNERILLLYADRTSGILFDSEETLRIEIYYNPGPAWYYMGDYDRGDGYNHSFPDASFSEQYQDGSGEYGNIWADELFEKYKIRLISWDYTQPIKNNFN